MTPITVSLDIQGMRHSIIHAFSQRSGELERMLDEQLKKALEALDVEAIVRYEADKVLREAITKAISGAIRDAFYQQPVRNIFDKTARKLAAQAIKEALEDL